LLGGRSYGGRMGSMAVAEGLPAAGLVLLSYPLHPPGKPERLRVEHFGAIRVPTLFVSGDKDPFGTPDELAEHVAAIPGPVTTVMLPGAHDMRGVGRQQAVAEAVAGWVASLGRPAGTLSARRPASRGTRAASCRARSRSRGAPRRCARAPRRAAAARRPGGR